MWLQSCSELSLSNHVIMFRIINGYFLSFSQVNLPTSFSQNFCVFITFVYLLCVCTTDVWMSEDNLWESVLSYHVCARD